MSDKFSIIEGRGPKCAQEGLREYGRVRRIWGWVCLEIWHWRVKRWLPHLVWLDDEVDVRITFSEVVLSCATKNHFALLLGDELYEIETRLRNIGIEFDGGTGIEGRDWEWDFSLRGPVSVKFKSRARNPERRVRPPLPPKPKLAGVP